MTVAQPLLLAVSLADRRPTPDHRAATVLARSAERAGLDLVVLEAGPLDPLLVAARIAASTSTIGVAPATPTTSTEPFHVSTALATIDVVSRGRAGWVVTVDDPRDVRDTVTWPVPDDVHGDATEHLDAVRALWDSWEEGAVVRDRATDRFLDADRVHHVDLEGRFLAVRGPSITPRPPQGHPPAIVRVTDDASLDLALRHGDALLTTDVALARGATPEDGSSVAGRAPAPRSDGPVRLLELPVDGTDADGIVGRLLEEHRAGVRGVLLHGVERPATLDALVAALVQAGVRVPVGAVPEPDPTGERPPVQPPPTLRGRLGLPGATNRFEVRA